MDTDDNRSKSNSSNLEERYKRKEEREVATYSLQVLAHIPILANQLRNLLLQTIVFLHQ